MKKLKSRGTRALWSLLAAIAVSWPLAVSAQLGAITTQPANMRAGPDRNFPLVAWLPGGAAVNVVGCTDGWRWCDVTSGFNRGWVYARFLSMGFQNQPTMVLSSGAMLGVPLISFSVNTYWGAHYRSRPWWDNRSYWSNRPPTWQGPPPRPPAARPPPRPPPAARPPSRPTPRPPTSGPSGGGESNAVRPPSSRPPSGRPPSDGRPPSGGRPPRDITSPSGQ